MGKKAFIPIIAIFLWSWLSACGPAAPGVETPEDTATPLPTETTAANTPALPQPLQLVVSQVTQALGLRSGDIVVMSLEAVQWRDSCFEAARPGELCLTVITPGYRLVLDTPQGQVEVRTDQEGRAYRLLPGPGFAVQEPAVILERSGGIAGACQRLTIGAGGIYLVQDCRAQAQRVVGVLSEQQADELKDWLNQYGEFAWETTPPPGSADMFIDQFTFYGRGSSTPGPQDEALIAQFLTGLADRLLALGGGLSEGQQNGESGIQGQAWIGPACPGPARQDTPCPDSPYQAEFSLLNQAGELVTRFQTDSAGRFHISLPPGTYILHPEITGRLPRAADQVVIVRPGEYNELQVLFDSGMR